MRTRRHECFPWRGEEQGRFAVMGGDDWDLSAAAWRTAHPDAREEL
ncbi:hypothetical protein ACWF9B_03480 [Streptomyces sp. NPDC055089]